MNTSCPENTKHSIYLIINGSLNMSPGKIASQSFQAAQRLFDLAAHPECPERYRKALAAWRNHGTRTITRIAETEHIFNRAIEELEGAYMQDEGMNEIAPGSITAFATWPLPDDERLPRMLRHKRIPVLSAQHIIRAQELRNG